MTCDQIVSCNDVLFQDDLAEKAIKLTAREKRFIKFASVEYDGQIYCKIF